MAKLYRTGTPCKKARGLKNFAPKGSKEHPCHPNEEKAQHRILAHKHSARAKAGDQHLLPAYQLPRFYGGEQHIQAKSHKAKGKLFHRVAVAEAHRGIAESSAYGCCTELRLMSHKKPCYPGAVKEEQRACYHFQKVYRYEAPVRYHPGKTVQEVDQRPLLLIKVSIRNKAIEHTFADRKEAVSIYGVIYRVKEGTFGAKCKADGCCSKAKEQKPEVQLSFCHILATPVLMAAS